MARPPRFTISALADLLHELRYAPPETLSRQMQAAEKLLTEIEVDRNYPEDYIRFRITSFRGEGGGDTVFVGSALLGDLAKFIERLSASLQWSAEQFAPRRALLPDEVAEKLNVSPVTLHRYRKEGLVAHQAIIDGDRARLIYFEDAVDRFVRQRQQSLQHAAKFSRIDPATRARIIRRARRYSASLHLSLNEAAKQLATRFGRSHEGIRRLLKQHDKQHPEQAIFADVGPLTDWQRRVILRAHDRAVPASELAARFRKAVNTIYRAALEQRADRLRTWEVHGVALPTFQLPDAEEVLLANAVVAQGLPVSLEMGGAFSDWIEQAPKLQLRKESEETQGIAGLHYLLWSARKGIDELDRHQPRAADIDLVETRLRWATRLKAKLLAGLRAKLISTVEIHLGRRLAQSPTSEIEVMHRLVTSAGARAIEVFDATRQGRLSQIAIHLLRAELARRAASDQATARPKREIGSMVLPDLPGVLFPWRASLELRPGAVEVADQLDVAARAILGQRFGWEGRPPRTQVEVGRQMGRPVHRVAAAEQRARRRIAQILRHADD